MWHSSVLTKNGFYFRPDPAKHSTEFDIFPELGVPVRVKLRMQMNVVLDQNQALKRRRHFDIIYPIFWFEAGIDSLPPNLVGKLQMAQDLPPLIKKVLLVLCGALSVLFVGILMANTVLFWCSSGLSSLRSRSDNGSIDSTPLETRPSTPASDADPHSPATAPTLSVLGTYKSYKAPNCESDADISAYNFVENGTLLPPYKSLPKNYSPGKVADPSDQHRNLNSQTSNTGAPAKKRLIGTNSNELDYGTSEPDASNNEYPPDYVQPDRSSHTLEPNTSSNSSVVSAEIHQYDVPHSELVGGLNTEYSNPLGPGLNNNPNQTSSSNSSHESVDPVRDTVPIYQRLSATYNVPGRSFEATSDSFHQMEHKSLGLLAAPKVVQEKLKKQEPPITLEVAPLALPEDVILPLTPTPDLNVPMEVLEGSPKNYRPLATSSPQVSSDDIKLPNFLGKKTTIISNSLKSESPTFASQNPKTSTKQTSPAEADFRTPVRIHKIKSNSLPSPRSNANSSRNNFSPQKGSPPLESDL